MIPIGYSALIEQFTLSVLPHYRLSYITPTGRGSETMRGRQHIVIYPKSYTLKQPNNPLAQLEFAIKHDGINLEIIRFVLLNISPKELEKYIGASPTGKYRRIIWFLYEWMLDQKSPLVNLKNVPYISILDSKKYYTAKGERLARYAIHNNLLGTLDFCPLVRKTQVLRQFENKNLSQQVQALTRKVDPAVLARAAHYLFTKETKSSFGIEKVKPDVKRTNKFIALLESATDIEKLDKKVLIELQNAIVDQVYQDDDYRKTQNYVGELTLSYTERIHYIPPKPCDLQRLMEGFLLCEKRLFDADIFPIVIAAVLSFGFVFLHPFEDGNGRIHRFLIHYALSKTGFTPNNIIFPVSAVMLKNIRGYDAILESFSKPLLHLITDYTLDHEGILSVKQETKTYYQYQDYTLFSEYLCDCIERTTHDEFEKELDFIQRYDKTKKAIQEIIDMPDTKIDRIIRCIRENKGILGRKIRKTVFSEISDKTIAGIETIVNKILLPETRTPPPPALPERSKMKDGTSSG